MIDKIFEEGVYMEDISAWDLEVVLPSAQLHDLGKIGVVNPGLLSCARKNSADTFFHKSC